MPTLLGKIKDAMFWMNQVNNDGMNKLDGNFFNKGKNELQQAIAELERQEYEQFYGDFSNRSADASD